jgi:hypothetical protein
VDLLSQMRTRTRTIVTRSVNRNSSLTPTGFVACDGTIINEPGSISAVSNVPSAALTEHIVDATGRGTVHPVLHRKFSYDINDAVGNETYSQVKSTKLGVITYAKPNSWFENSNVYVRDTHSWDVTSQSSLPPFWSLEIPGNEASHINDVLERAQGLKADALLNVVEANQIWPSITSLANALPEMAKNWREIRKVIRTASGAFLAWKFGVSPILSDTMNIIQHLPRLKTDILRHKNGDKQRTIKSVPVNLTFDDGHFYASPYYTGSYVTSTFEHQGRLTSTPTLKYVLVTEPQVRYHTAVFRSIDVALRRFASSPAQLAWELVPFSFVLDWFVDLRGVARSVDSMLGFSPWNIKGFTRSLSYSCATDCFTGTYSGCNGSSLQSWRSVTCDYKHYGRSVITGGSLPSWNQRFGKNQAAISAALISQQLSRVSGAKR